MKECSSIGRAPVSKTGGLGFESLRSCQLELKIMRNPIKFIQEVKQEAFKVSWPTWKETLQGALMVFAMAVVMSLFFLLLDQVLKFFLELLLKVSI